LKNFAVQILPCGGGAEHVSEPDAEVGLLEDIEQARHRPAFEYPCLEGDEISRLRLNGKRGKCDPAAILFRNCRVSLIIAVTVSAGGIYL